MPCLIIADHASNAIPPALEPFGVSAADLARHIAWDIGTAAFAASLAAKLGCPSVVASWSRLVIDLNRPPDHPGLIPEHSDGTVIPANSGLTVAQRADRIRSFYDPYHQAISAAIDRHQPRLLITLHSFTEQMQGMARPWHVGLLYNRDDRAARLALDGFRRDPALVVGDNEPYSGQQLNYTMDRHAEARGLPYLSLEIRQDLLVNQHDIDEWSDRIAAVTAAVLTAV